MRATALLLGLAACGPALEHQATPPVQFSVAAAARWTVDINRVRDGVFRPYAPRCFDVVEPGETVAFRNFLPEIPANVTAVAQPAGATPLYSPNLVRPYGYVGPGDPANTLCEAVAADGTCTRRPAWSEWRYTFETAGVYDWIDTNQSSPGRQVVDPYYGTVTFIGLDPDSPLGTVCVAAQDGTGCEGVCCRTDADCNPGTRCFIGEVDAAGRCLTPTG